MNLEKQGRSAADFAERVRIKQQELAADLKPHYDFIVCGAGTSGSVVAARLAAAPRAFEKRTQGWMLPTSTI